MAESIESEAPGSFARAGWSGSLARAAGVDAVALSQTFRLAVLGAILLFFALQLWRPHFFLTDDALTAFLPILKGTGAMMLKGEFPARLEGIHNGEARMFGTAEYMWVYHPLSLLGALLANSPLCYWTVDGIALFCLLIGIPAMAAACLAWAGRTGRGLQPREATFVALSYFGAFYTLAVGSSWPNFLISQAALPVMVLGILSKGWWRIGLIAGASWLSLYAGHPQAFAYSLFVVGLLAIWFAVEERSSKPVVAAGVAVLLGIAIYLPVLWPALQGFGGTARAEGTGVRDPWSIPFHNQILGGTVGIIWPLASYAWDLSPEPMLPFFSHPLDYFTRHPHVGTTFTFSAGGLLVLAVCFGFRKWSRWDLGLGGLLLLLMTIVARPPGVAEVLGSLPLLRSFRWPMREALEMLFLAHLLVAGRMGGLSDKVKAWAGGGGVALYVATLALSGPPSLNPVALDRELLVSGEAARAWKEVRQKLGVTDDVRIVPFLNPNDFFNSTTLFMEFPNSLSGGYNFPLMFGMKSATGYTQTGFKYRFEGYPPLTIAGYFPPEVVNLPREIRDRCLLVEIARLKPWEVRMAYNRRIVRLHAEGTRVVVEEM